MMRISPEKRFMSAMEKHLRRMTVEQIEVAIKKTKNILRRYKRRRGER